MTTDSTRLDAVLSEENDGLVAEPALVPQDTHDQGFRLISKNLSGALDQLHPTPRNHADEQNNSFVEFEDLLTANHGRRDQQTDLNRPNEDIGSTEVACDNHADSDGGERSSIPSDIRRSLWRGFHTSGADEDNAANETTREDDLNRHDHPDTGDGRSSGIHNSDGDEDMSDPETGGSTSHDESGEHSHIDRDADEDSVGESARRALEYEDDEDIRGGAGAGGGDELRESGQEDGESDDGDGSRDKDDADGLIRGGINNCENDEDFQSDAGANDDDLSGSGQEDGEVDASELDNKVARDGSGDGDGSRVFSRGAIKVQEDSDDIQNDADANDDKLTESGEEDDGSDAGELDNEEELGGSGDEDDASGLSRGGIDFHNDGDDFQNDADADGHELDESGDEDDEDEDDGLARGTGLWEAEDVEMLCDLAPVEDGESGDEDDDNDIGGLARAVGLQNDEDVEMLSELAPAEDGEYFDFRGIQSSTESDEEHQLQGLERGMSRSVEMLPDVASSEEGEYSDFSGINSGSKNEGDRRRRRSEEAESPHTAGQETDEEDVWGGIVETYKVSSYQCLATSTTHIKIYVYLIFRMSTRKLWLAFFGFHKLGITHDILFYLHPARTRSTQYTPCELSYNQTPLRSLIWLSSALLQRKGTLQSSTVTLTALSRG